MDLENRQPWRKFTAPDGLTIVKAARFHACLRLPRFVFVGENGRIRLRLPHKRSKIIAEGDWVIVGPSGCPYTMKPAIFNRLFCPLGPRLLYR